MEESLALVQHNYVCSLQGRGPFRQEHYLMVCSQAYLLAHSTETLMRQTFVLLLKPLLQLMRPLEKRVNVQRVVER